MARGGYAELPDGSVIVALTLPGPGGGPGRGAPARVSPARVPGSRRRWSAHADEAHTVRAAAPPRQRPGDASRARVLVHARNRARALTRLRNLGLRAVYLNGNTEPPSPDEITAVLHHPDGLVWRPAAGADRGSWRPIGSLLRLGAA